VAIGVTLSVIGCEPYSSRLHETSSVVQRCDARPAKGSPPEPVASLAMVGVQLSTSGTGTAQGASRRCTATCICTLRSTSDSRPR
jgi:hypothetical protein